MDLSPDDLDAVARTILSESRVRSWAEKKRAPMAWVGAPGNSSPKTPGVYQSVAGNWLPK
jgi:hypothetical protein